MRREQFTPELEMITDRNLSFICPYALLSKKCFYSFKNEHFFLHYDIFLCKKQKDFSQAYFIEKK